MKNRPHHANVQLELEGTADQVLAKLEETARADRRAEVRKAMVKPFVWVFGVGAGLLAVFALVRQEDDGLLSTWTWLAGAAAVASVGAWVVHRQVAAADVEDRKLAVAEEVVRTLRADFKPGKPLKLSIDFRHHARCGLVAEAHRWLALQAPLADGTVLTLTGSTSANRKTKPKRKYTKVKERVKESLRVRLAPPKGRTFATQAQLAGERDRRAPIVPLLKLRGAVLKPGAADVVFVTDEYRYNFGRHGETHYGYTNLLHGRSVVHAVIASYGLVSERLKDAA